MQFILSVDVLGAHEDDTHSGYIKSTEKQLDTRQCDDYFFTFIIIIAERVNLNQDPGDHGKESRQAVNRHPLEV